MLLPTSKTSELVALPDVLDVVAGLDVATEALAGTSAVGGRSRGSSGSEDARSRTAADNHSRDR